MHIPYCKTILTNAPQEISTSEDKSKLGGQDIRNDLKQNFEASKAYMTYTLTTLKVSSAYTLSLHVPFLQVTFTFPYCAAPHQGLPRRSQAPMIPGRFQKARRIVGQDSLQAPLRFVFCTSCPWGIIMKMNGRDSSCLRSLPTHAFFVPQWGVMQSLY